MTLTGSIWGTKALQNSFSAWRTALRSQIPAIHGLHVTYSSADKRRVAWPAVPPASGRIAGAGRAQRSLVSAGTCLLPTPSSLVSEPQAAPPQQDTSSDRFFRLWRCADKLNGG